MSDTDTSAVEATEAWARRARWVNDLRAVADFVEAHPDVDLPDASGSRFHLYVYNADPKAELARLARALGRCDKRTTDYHFSLSRSIGVHEIVVLAARESVCTQVQVGTRQIERTTYPDDVRPTVELVDEPVYEWRCPESILAEAAFDEATKAAL